MSQLIRTYTSNLKSPKALILMFSKNSFPNIHTNAHPNGVWGCIKEQVDSRKPIQIPIVAITSETCFRHLCCMVTTTAFLMN